MRAIFMVKFGYRASHEQFKPSRLLEYVQTAEKAGFSAVLSSSPGKKQL